MVDPSAGLLLVRPGCKREQDLQRRGVCAGKLTIPAAVEAAPYGKFARCSEQRSCVDERTASIVMPKPEESLCGDFRHNAVQHSQPMNTEGHWGLCKRRHFLTAILLLAFIHFGLTAIMLEVLIGDIFSLPSPRSSFLLLPPTCKYLVLEP